METNSETESSDKQKDLILLRHKLKMEELIYERESNKLFHERELERIRIKSAEVRRKFERRQNEHFASDYARKQI